MLVVLGLLPGLEMVCWVRGGDDPRVACLADGKVPAGDAVGGTEGVSGEGLEGGVQCSYPYSILRMGVQYSIYLSQSREGIFNFYHMIGRRRASS